MSSTANGSNRQVLGEQDPSKGIASKGWPYLLALGSAMVARSSSECHSTLRFIGVVSPWLPVIVFASLVWFWWVSITIALWVLGERYREVFRISILSVLSHVVVGSLLALAHMSILRELVYFGTPRWPAWGHAYMARGCITGERFGIDLAIYAFLFMFSASLHHQLTSRLIRVQKLALERQLSEAQLQTLRMQLEPHFLFNALNSVASLVDLGRNPEASEAIMHLNTILRTSLRQSTPDKVPCSQELRVVESYLAIQQVRFADRLEVRFDTAPEAMAGLVPSFLLQPVVENAIHHGISMMESGGVIETSVKRVGDSLFLQVSDNGAGSTGGPKGHGIGLRNLRERLAFFYPGQHSFEAKARATGGFQVTISIPFELQPL